MNMCIIICEGVLTYEYVEKISQLHECNTFVEREDRQQVGVTGLVHLTSSVCSLDADAYRYSSTRDVRCSLTNLLTFFKPCGVLRAAMVQLNAITDLEDFNQASNLFNLPGRTLHNIYRVQNATLFVQYMTDKRRWTRCTRLEPTPQ